jgi:hypothetical protein
MEESANISNPIVSDQISYFKGKNQNKDFFFAKREVDKAITVVGFFVRCDNHHTVVGMEAPSSRTMTPTAA